MQDQCCRILSSLLDFVENNASHEIITALGEQLQVPVLPIQYFLCYVLLYLQADRSVILLQFLVSKLVESCCLSNTNGGNSQPGFSYVLSVLCQLILQSNPSLHDYIRVRSILHFYLCFCLLYFVNLLKG